MLKKTALTILSFVVLVLIACEGPGIVNSVNAAGGGSPPSPMPAQQGKKPNILLLMSDDVGIANISAYSHGLVGYKTPNIDRIAQSGTLFENAYCSHPICCPSRANMWSGQYTHNCESWNNYKGLESGMWSMPACPSHALKRAS